MKSVRLLLNVRYKNILVNKKNDIFIKLSWPFQQVGGGDEAGAGGVAGQFLGLPPEGVRLVHDLQDVTFPEAHTGVGAGDGRVLLRAVVGHGAHVELTPGELGLLWWNVALMQINR